jgi:hypothetical protein
MLCFGIFRKILFVKMHIVCINQNNHYICPIPSKLKTMKYRLFYLVAVIAITSLTTSCKKSGGKSGSGYAVDKGQLIGVAPGSKWSLPKPPGLYSPGNFSHGIKR